MTRKQRNLNHYGLHRALSVGVAVAIGGLTLSATPVLAQCEEPLHTWHGDNEGDSFGFSVSGAGDVDADGFDDVIVGASFNDMNGESSGKAFVFSGATGAILFTWHGDSAGDRFGRGVAGVGDLDGDGFDDVIVGAWLNDANGENSGSAYVFSGATGAVLYTFHGDRPDAKFGFAVSAAGDVNGDGNPDFIIGAWTDDANGDQSGSASVYSGNTGALLHYWTGISGELGEQFGYSVSGGGDANGDGFSDVIVGARRGFMNGTRSGSAYLLSGQTGDLLHSWHGDSEADELGYSVGGAGDVNGDGYDDVIVGSRRNDQNGNDSGSAFVFSGANGAVLYAWHGESAEGEFGYSVSNAGDIDEDGVDDVIIGAPQDTLTGNNSGSAHVFSGSTGMLLRTWHGDSAGSFLGYDVSSAGDVNGDGFNDVVVGVPFNTAGKAFVFTLNCSATCPWDLDDSGDVGVKDLLFLLGEWGPCPPKGDCPADFDNTGDVGVKDLLFLLGAWGPCP